MRYNIGVVNFLNAYPLFFGFDKLYKNIRVIKDVPSRLSLLLRQNKLDAALISSIEYYRNKENYDFHKGLCISSKGKVESIRLFLSKDNDIVLTDNTINKPIDTLFFDYASRSSVEMIKILLKKHFPETNLKTIERNPPYENIIENLKTNESLILIGDLALNNRNKKSIDLGLWYHKTFNKPFVYALWVFHKSSKIDTEIFENVFRYSKENWQKMIHEASLLFNFPAGFSKKYFENLIFYEMTPENLGGLSFFFQEYDKLISF
ncbi:MAG: menaquinone biosynthesis protein [Spirochaetia bacterium]|nr:menaquinone biosynthesis protein [Spirochaetia bacterium]